MRRPPPLPTAPSAQEPVRDDAATAPDEAPRAVLPPVRRPAQAPLTATEPADATAVRGLDGAAGAPVEDAGTSTASDADVAATSADDRGAGTRDADPDATGPDADHDAGGDAVGLRDVWAAARARRRALRAEVRRFTVRQRRRRMVWISVVGALALLVLGSIGAAYSPLFAVEKIEVVGTSTLSAADVEAALDGQLGTPLPRVDSSAIKAALVQFPLVESYTLEARPPHELVVRIVERTPIGSVQSAAGYTLVDAAGVALSMTPQPAEGHPVIDATGGVGSPAFEAIGTVFRTLPDDIRSQVTAMSGTTANDVTLTLGGTNTQIVWGNSDDSQKKAVRLAAAMKARPPADVYSYDVSSVDAVVIR